MESEPIRQALADTLQAGSEENVVPAEAPLELKVRAMLTYDYDQVGEINGLNLALARNWTLDRIKGYAQVEHAFVAQDPERLWSQGLFKLAGFLAIETIPDPGGVEIVRLAVRPDYPELERVAVARELLDLLRGKYPDQPIRMMVHEDDRSLLDLLKGLGSRSTPVQGVFGNRDGVQFILADAAENPPALPDLNEQAQKIWVSLKSGNLEARQAVLGVLRLLEQVAETEEFFSSWEEAYQVLSRVDQEIGLGGAVALKLFARQAMGAYENGQDPIPDLKRQIELFREGFKGQAPSRYLEGWWQEEMSVVEIRRRMEQKEFSSRAAAVEVLRVLEGLRLSDHPFSKWADVHEILLRAKLDQEQDGSHQKFLRSLAPVLKQIGVLRARSTHAEDLREELFVFLERYQQRHARRRSPSQVLERDWPAEKESAPPELDEPQAGMEEFEISRRALLQAAAKGVSFLNMGGLPDVGTILEKLAAVSLPLKEEQLATVVQALKSHIGLHRSWLETMIGDFKKSPAGILETWEKENRTWVSHIGAGSYSMQVKKQFISGVSEAQGSIQSWLARLDSGTGSPTTLPGPMASSILGGKQSGPIEVIEHWRNQNTKTLSKMTAFIKQRMEIPEDDPFMRDVTRAFEQQIQGLDLFGKLDPAQQKQVLRTVLEDRLKEIESVAEQVRVVEDHVGRMGERWERELEQQRRVLNERAEILRQRIASAQVRVPPRAVFIAFVPLRGLSSRPLVDDWVLLEREAKRNPLLKEIELQRIEVSEGEDVVEKALSLLRQRAQPGSQMTVGFGLGILSAEQSARLREAWPEIRTTADPWLAYSARYIQKEMLDVARFQHRHLMPTLSEQFADWITDPSPGVRVFLPKVTLPKELWVEFEWLLRNQAGLEQAV